MQTKMAFIAGIVSLFLVTGVGRVLAQEETAARGSNIKQEISQDKQQLGEQKGTAREHAQAAKAEEGQLREEVHQAIQSGDMARAKELRDELKATHRENIQEKQADMRALHESRRELKQDMTAAEGGRPLPFKLGKGIKRMQSMSENATVPPPDAKAPSAQGQPGLKAPVTPPPMRKEAAMGEHMRERIEALRDKREDIRDRREDRRDRREDRHDQQMGAGSQAGGAGMGGGANRAMGGAGAAGRGAGARGAGMKR